MMKRAISLPYNWLNIGRIYSRLRHIGQDTGSFYAFGSLGSFYQLSTCASLVAHRVKNPHCRRPGLDPWVGKIPWRGNSYPLQYSCPENSIDRGVWQATANGVVESDSTFTFFNHAQVVKTQGKNAQRPPPWSSVLTGAAGHV